MYLSGIDCAAGHICPAAFHGKPLTSTGKPVRILDNRLYLARNCWHPSRHICRL